MKEFNSITCSHDDFLRPYVERYCDRYADGQGDVHCLISYSDDGKDWIQTISSFRTDHFSHEYACLGLPIYCRSIRLYGIFSTDFEECPETIYEGIFDENGSSDPYEAAWLASAHSVIGNADIGSYLLIERFAYLRMTTCCDFLLDESEYGEQTFKELIKP